MDRTSLSQLLGDLSPSKSVVMKLLYVEDYEFQPAEVRYLAQVSGCEVPEVLDRIDRLRATVREREAGLKRMEDALDAVQAWIQLYERRVQRISDDLAALPPTSMAAERLREERRPARAQDPAPPPAARQAARPGAAPQGDGAVQGHRGDAEHQHRQYRLADRAPAARVAHQGGHGRAEPRATGTQLDQMRAFLIS